MMMPGLGMFRITYSDQRPGQKKGAKVKDKASISSATNLIHRVHSSLNMNLLSVAMADGDDWIEYDMPWENLWEGTRLRLVEIAEHHEVWHNL